MKTTFSICFLFLFLIINGYSQVNLSNGLRAQYDFNGNTNDLTGNGFNGILNGATLSNDRFGNSGNAYHFDGINQNIEVQNFQSIISGNEITISCWIKADVLKSQGIMFLFPDDNTDRLFASAYYSHNGISSTFWDYGDIFNDGRLGSVGTFFQPVWEHYVFVSSTSQNMMQVYRNGYLQFMKTSAVSLIDKNKILCIGGNMGDMGVSNYFFNGSIDDVRIYDRVLNPAEILSLNHGYYESDVKDLRVFVTNWPNPRPGFPELLNVVYQNVGTTQISGYVELNYDANYSFIQAVPTQDSINTNFLSWTFNNLPPGGQGVFQVQLTLPASVSLGTPLMSSATIYPIAGDTVPSDNYDTLHQTVVSGCDPNYIEVTPAGDITPVFVTSGSYLYYTIHFQNVGNASAINIRIEDDLEPDYTISSVEIIGTSHPYTFSLGNDNKLIFYFDNINLIDSASDPLASTGFVMYKIKTLASLQPGDQLSNNANIFFDFNQPVLTNTVITNVVNPSAVFYSASDDKSAIKIFPNPFKKEFNLEFESKENEVTELELLNLLGILVLKEKHKTIAGVNKVTLSTGVIPAGIYFLKITSGSGFFTRKVVKE